MNKCPHCGSDLGVYSKEYVRYAQFYDWDGEPDSYSDPEDLRYRKTTPVYCIKCDKYVCKLKKLMEESNDRLKRAIMY